MINPRSYNYCILKTFIIFCSFSIFLSSCLPEVPVCSKALNDNKIICNTNWNINYINVVTSKHNYVFKKADIAFEKTDLASYKFIMKNNDTILQLTTSLNCSDVHNYVTAAIEFQKDADTILNASYNSYGGLYNSKYEITSEIMWMTPDSTIEHLRYIKISLTK